MKLIFDSVCAAYRQKTVLEDVSFRVERGSVTALIGLNGAGKSTLVSCLTGEKGDYRGTITLDGQDTRQLSPSRRACMMACLPQDLLRPRVTVGELVAFGRAPYLPLTGKLSRQDEEAVAWALAATDTAALAETFVDELSGGQRKKVFLAMALAQDTELVVLDEPAAHLDMVSRFELLALIRKLREQTGKTFLLVMHELPEVLRFADRIVALHDGRVAFDGTAEAFLEEQIPQRCFGVRVAGNRERGYAVTPLT